MSARVRIGAIWLAACLTVGCTDDNPAPTGLSVALQMGTGCDSNLVLSCASFAEATVVADGATIARDCVELELSADGTGMTLEQITGALSQLELGPLPGDRAVSIRLAIYDALTGGCELSALNRPEPLISGQTASVLLEESSEEAVALILDCRSVETDPGADTPDEPVQPACDEALASCIEATGAPNCDAYLLGCKNACSQETEERVDTCAAICAYTSGNTSDGSMDTKNCVDTPAGPELSCPEQANCNVCFNGRKPQTCFSFCNSLPGRCKQTDLQLDTCRNDYDACLQEPPPEPEPEPEPGCLTMPGDAR